MPQVEVIPLGAVFEIQPGETIIEAAWRNGYFWPTICDGQGTCKTCVLMVVEGEQNLSAIEAWEREGLDEIVATLPNGGEGWRLACQVKADGDVRVRKVGVRLAAPAGDTSAGGESSAG